MNNKFYTLDFIKIKIKSSKKVQHNVYTYTVDSYLNPLLESKLNTGYNSVLYCSLIVSRWSFGEFGGGKVVGKCSSDDSFTDHLRPDRERHTHTLEESQGASIININISLLYPFYRFRVNFKFSHDQENKFCFK